MARFQDMTNQELIAAHWRYRHAVAMFVRSNAHHLSLLENMKVIRVEEEAARRGLVLTVRTPA